MGTAPGYIEASGAELDCGILLSETEWVRGFLRLPTLRDSGRIRFVEDIPSVAAARQGDAPLAVFLLDRASGTPACLINYYVKRHEVRAPTPPPFPLELVVNSVIVGSDNADQVYDCATVRCEALAHLFDVRQVTAERVARQGSCTKQRLGAADDDWTLTVAEGAEINLGETAAAIRWFGEITIRGAPRTLDQWTELLASALLLFAVLLDRPLKPDRIYADDGSKHVGYYATWSERSAPERTVALMRFTDIESRFDHVVRGWNALWKDTRDLVDHVGEYQLFRELHTHADRVLTLFRCLELYHDSRSRFASVVRSSDEHRKLVNDVLASLPDALRSEHGDWIEQALRGAHRKRLVDQIRDILKDLTPAILGHCHIEEAERFASAAKASRNFFTHPTRRAPRDVPQGRELVILINKLWFVARACLLIELGFTREETAAALKRSAERHYLLS